GGGWGRWLSGGAGGGWGARLRVDRGLDGGRELLQRDHLVVGRLHRLLDAVGVPLLGIAEDGEHAAIEDHLVDDFDRHPVRGRVGEAEGLERDAVEGEYAGVGHVLVAEDDPDAGHPSSSRFGAAARTASTRAATSGLAASSSVKIAIPSLFICRALKLTYGSEKRPPGLTSISLSIRT